MVHHDDELVKQEIWVVDEVATSLEMLDIEPKLVKVVNLLLNALVGLCGGLMVCSIKM